MQAVPCARSGMRWEGTPERVILIEAKAHLRELASPATQASPCLSSGFVPASVWSKPHLACRRTSAGLAR